MRRRKGAVIVNLCLVFTVFTLPHLPSHTHTHTHTHTHSFTLTHPLTHLDRLKFMPGFMLKRVVLGSYPAGDLEVGVANSVDFMIERVRLGAGAVG